MKTNTFDVVVTDIILPQSNGVELLKTIHHVSPEIQVIMMTGEPTLDTATEALRFGAFDYLPKPISKASICKIVNRAATFKALKDENKRYQQNLELLVEEQTQMLRESLEQTQKSHTALKQAYDETLLGWAKALELHDIETYEHTTRVTEMAVELAIEMGIEEGKRIHIRRGALLHDIGKMGVPNGILQKKGPLTPEERTVIEKHPAYAYELLHKIQYLAPALDIPRYHHEKWNGTGYPYGLQGEEIPLPARIFAIIDVWDALTSDRPYRKAWSMVKTLDYLRSQTGTHFDPDVAASFFRYINP